MSAPTLLIATSCTPHKISPPSLPSSSFPSCFWFPLSWQHGQLEQAVCLSFLSCIILIRSFSNFSASNMRWRQLRRATYMYTLSPSHVSHTNSCEVYGTVFMPAVREHVFPTLFVSLLSRFPCFLLGIKTIIDVYLYITCTHLSYLPLVCSNVTPCIRTTSGAPLLFVAFGTHKTVSGYKWHWNNRGLIAVWYSWGYRFKSSWVVILCITSIRYCCWCGGILRRTSSHLPCLVQRYDRISSFT